VRFVGDLRDLRAGERLEALTERIGAAHQVLGDKNDRGDGARFYA
jgi:hypothetical protein